MTAPLLTPVDIGHARYVALTDPGAAFWALVDKTQVADTLAGGPLLDAYRAKAADFTRELRALRFELKPSAVYVNPTERCNLDCAYCYLPGTMRREGRHMPQDRLLAALDALRRYFATVMPEGRRPRIIFHGSEPLMNRTAVFAAIEAFGADFVFGLQTNGTLLDSSAIDFLAAREVSIGLSLDGPEAAITDSTRRTWAGRSVHARVLAAMDHSPCPGPQDRCRGGGNPRTTGVSASPRLRHHPRLLLRRTGPGRDVHRAATTVGSDQGRQMRYQGAVLRQITNPEDPDAC